MISDQILIRIPIFKQVKRQFYLIVEVVEIRSTSYGVKLVESSTTINPFIRSKDEIKFLSDGKILLRIPKNVIVDKEWFHPYFRESNLNELLK